MLSCDHVTVGGGSPLKEQEKLADWPGIVMTSTGCWMITGRLGGAGEESKINEHEVMSTHMLYICM